MQFTKAASCLNSHWPKCWGLRNVNNRQKCRKKNYRQSSNKIFFEQLWNVFENTKFVHYFDNSKGNFFRGQNLNGLAENQVQNLSTSRGRHLSVSDWSLWVEVYIQFVSVTFQLVSKGFTHFIHEKRPQINLPCQNFSMENSYFLMTLLKLSWWDKRYQCSIQWNML